MISFTGSEGKKIEVREYYEPLDGIPEDNFYTRLQISGTTVIEDDYSDIGTTANGSIGYIDSYHYNWIEEPILFSVYTENVDKDEVLDLIRSMIE